MTDSQSLDGVAIDPRHLLIILAGPGLGSSIARRFGQGGYHVTLLARGTDGVGKRAAALDDTGAIVDTLTADAGDHEDLRATLTSLYARAEAPGLLVYNAAKGTPDSLMPSDARDLHRAYDVDVVGAVMATQVAAPAMQAAGGGTIL